MFIKHSLHYLLLALILLSGLVGFGYFSSNRTIRFGIVLLTIAGYVLWGIGHHYLEKRLSWSIIFEYLLLGFVILAATSLIARF